MSTALYTHPVCLEHDTGFGHPECAERLKAVLKALDQDAFAALDRRIAPQATGEQLERVHPRSYVERVLNAIPHSGHAEIDNDTVVCPQSGDAALRAAGAVCAAVDAVMAGEVGNAFCAVRPPGHHAESARAMGFCLFNNVAVGAAQARAVHGLERIAVVDFDVHHGNGTQEIFERDAGLLYCSTHQAPLYPGTGAAHERGAYDNIVNMPLKAESGSPEFRHAFTVGIFPAIEAFRPDMILVSAGFDAHFRDPLANLSLVDDDYVWVTRKLGALAREHCGGRLVSVLEGGYHIGALASSCAAHVQALMAI